MTPLLANILSLSICIAGIIAVARFDKISKIYQPFLYLVLVCCLYEIADSILLATGIGSKMNIYNIIDNIYNLLLFLLTLSFLKNFAHFKRYELTYGLAAISLSIVWVIEIFTSGQIYDTHIYFSIISSFVIVLLSINTINILIATINRRLIADPIFIICLAFIIKFTYNALVAVFWLYGLNKNRELLVAVVSIIFYISFIANILYAIAILMMPKKEPYRRMNVYT